MTEENKKRGKRYGIIAACAVLALAAVFGAYQAGRSAGDGGDIGQEAAKAAALTHAGFSESELPRYEIERDGSGRTAVYKVEFTAADCDYAYEISAADGSIVKFSREETGTPAPSGTPPVSATAPADSQVDEAKAWEIAYAHAGVEAAESTASPAKLDYDDGLLVYELEFFAGGYEYDYEVSAADGSVVKFEKEANVRTSPVQTKPAAPAANTSGSSGSSSVPTSGSSSTAQSSGTTGAVGEPRAKEIALGHAGVTAGSISNYKWELDYEDGVQVYELEFTSGGYEYDYEIDAASGAVVKFEKEALEGYAAQGTMTADAVSYIGEARAKEIAYGHACLAADAVARCTVELDHHDGHHGGHHSAGCCTYEIDFRSGGYEYEYKIDAVTGEILEFEQEVDD